MCLLLFNVLCCLYSKKHYVTPRAKQIKSGSKDLPVNLRPQNILADQVTNYLRM